MIIKIITVSIHLSANGWQVWFKIKVKPGFFPLFPFILKIPLITVKPQASELSGQRRASPANGFWASPTAPVTAVTARPRGSSTPKSKTERCAHSLRLLTSFLIKSRFHKIKEERCSVLGGERATCQRTCTAPSSFCSAFSHVTNRWSPAGAAQ